MFRKSPNHQNLSNLSLSQCWAVRIAKNTTYWQKNLPCCMYVCYFYLGNFMATQWKSSCRVQGRRSTCRYCWYSCLFGCYWSHFLCLKRSLPIRDTLLTLWWTSTRTYRWPRTPFIWIVSKTGYMGKIFFFKYLCNNSWVKYLKLSRTFNSTLFLPSSNGELCISTPKNVSGIFGHW